MKTEINLTGAELLDELHAVMRRDRAMPADAGDSLSKVLAPESIELLRVLSSYAAPSVSALATKLGRSQPNVSRTLTLLVKHGFVRMVRKGRHVQPELIGRRIHIQFDVTTGRFLAMPAAG